MTRVMVGGPVPTLGELGKLTGLPGRRMDLIHWQPGWVERGRQERDRLSRAVHAALRVHRLRARRETRRALASLRD